MITCPYLVMRNFDCNRDGYGIPKNELPTEETNRWYYKFFNEYKDAEFAYYDGEKRIIHRDAYDGIVRLLPLNYKELEEQRRNLLIQVMCEFRDSGEPITPHKVRKRLNELLEGK